MQVSGRDALSAKKAKAEARERQASAEQPAARQMPALLALVAAALFWLIAAALQRQLGGVGGYLYSVGKWLTVACVLGCVLLLVILGSWARSVSAGSDSCWMRLCGKGSVRVVRGALWLVDQGPGRAAPDARLMTQAALRKAAELRSNRPAVDSILFVGGSAFAHWRSLENDFSPLPVVNAAFGGSSTAQLNAHFSRLVKRNSPAVIVYHCGTDDLLCGLPASACEAGFREFVRLCRECAECRMCPIVFLAVHTTDLHRQSGESRVAAIDGANRLVRNYIKSEDEADRPAAAPEPAPALLQPEPEPEAQQAESPVERDNGVATWHAGMVSQTVAVAGTLPLQPAAAWSSVPARGPKEPAGGPLSAHTSPPPPSHGPLFFVDFDAAPFAQDPGMHLNDGHSLNAQGHAALGALLRPIVEPLWRARTS